MFGIAEYIAYMASCGQLQQKMWKRLNRGDMLVDVVTLKTFGQPEHAARPRVFVQCLDKQESSADIAISNKTWIGTNASELQIYLAVYGRPM